uniref:F-box domain-containing protein n=1 Tax=Triticum urartu TaxID=4572 RepID=A0A8R7QTR4_TRIUA
MYRLRGWPDLPEGLLYSIIARLGLVSFSDLVAFSATCRSWHAAFSTLVPLLPPLLLRPDVPMCFPRHPPMINKLVRTRPCHATNIANQDTYQCCQIPLHSIFGENNTPPSPLKGFRFSGASYGHLIFSRDKSCLVVDVFTGASVSSPKLPIIKDIGIFYAALTAPLASPNSHIVVDIGSRNLFWRVGSQYWVGRSPDDGPIKQIVVFKGRVFGIDSNLKLFKVQLTPQICIQEIPVMESTMIRKWHHSDRWLVICGDMLLLVSLRGTIIVTGVTFEVFRLDLSTAPALWLKVEKLENWAIFISTDKRSQALSCMNPKIWGGRSNCVYCYNHDSKHWVALELGKPLQGNGPTSKFNPNIFIFMGRDSRVQPMWVVPSMLSFCR